MYKINSTYSRKTLLGENDIYRKFNLEFESLFNPDEIAKTDDDFCEIYVNDEEFEKSLNDFFSSHTSMAKFCVGYTGIGKTTSIRYCLELHASNMPKLITHKKMVVFPTFLDGYRVEEMQKFDLSKRIASVCTILEKEHPDLREDLKTLEGKRDFYDFMFRHNNFSLENTNPVTTMDMSEEELIIHSLEKAYEEDHFIYQANRLKYYIFKKREIYNRLVILLDDIETLPQENQREIIKKYLKLFDCMKNTDYEDNSNYNVNLLISMRPHTHRYLHGDRDIETHPLSKPILKSEAVDISELFKKRFNFYSKKYRTESSIGNRDSWKECYDAVMSMNRTFDGKYKRMIQNLCFFNIRESLTAYARIFANRLWVQKNMIKTDAFTITPKDYVFNNVTVIRALACNEEPVFFGASDSLIPNIFYTTQFEDYSMHCLAVIRYFIMKRNGEDYGINAQELRFIHQELNDIFNEHYAEQFHFVIKYLFDNKILRKSINDHDDIDAIETITANSSLYISPRGNEIFEMLSKDSVLLEMLRESSWRDYKNREYSKSPSIELTRNRDYTTVYIDLLDYIDYLCEKEDDIYTRAIQSDKFQKYFSLFDSTSISGQLLIGLKNSMNYSDRIDTDECIKNKLLQTENKIESLEEKILNLLKNN